MKKIISEIPKRISILSVITLMTIIILFTYLLFTITVKDIIYSGSVNDIKIDSIKGGSSFNIQIGNRLLHFENVVQLKERISAYSIKDNTQCVISVDRKMIEYFML